MVQEHLDSIARATTQQAVVVSIRNPSRQPVPGLELITVLLSIPLYHPVSIPMAFFGHPEPQAGNPDSILQKATPESVTGAPR